MVDKLLACPIAGVPTESIRMKTIGKSLIAATLAVVVSITAQAEGDATKGEKVFRKCKACHSMDAKKKIGPSLAGIMGRKAGAVEGYRYSKVFQTTEIVWDENTLAAYLKAPRKFMKGTKMAFAGLRKPEEIADVIAYMAAAGE